MHRRGFLGRLVGGVGAAFLVAKRGIAGERPCYLMWDGEQIHELWDEAAAVPADVLRFYRGACENVAIRSSFGPDSWICRPLNFVPNNGVLAFSRSDAERWLRQAPKLAKPPDHEHMLLLGPEDYRPQGNYHSRVWYCNGEHCTPTSPDWRPA